MDKIQTKPLATGVDSSSTKQLWSVPSVFTSLVGREQAIAQSCALLTSQEIRLITLLGIGGIGKTRLSIAIARELRAIFTHGICFVSLSSTRTTEQVLMALADELGLQEKDCPYLTQLQKLLRNRNWLLILDNVEQIDQIGLLLEELLNSCPGVKIIATSRIALRIPAEHQFWVQPLTMPSLNDSRDDLPVEEYTAITLFVQRTRALLPGFQLTTANRSILAQICACLDGLPLAIELAAARSKLLSPHALLPRLDRSLQLLTRGMSTQPTRQQTLRATLQWSYDLLPGSEQRLFRLCAIFERGFTLEAIEAVCPSDVRASSASVLDGIDTLIDKSLIQPPRLTEEEEPRLELLALVREFGRECLLVEGALEEARRMHAEYYLTLAERAAPHFDTVQEKRWRRIVERDRANLRMAMEWSLTYGRQMHTMEFALRLGSALGPFWIGQGHFAEGWTFLAVALKERGEVSGKVLAEALSTASTLTIYLNEVKRSVALAEQSLALFKSLGDDAGVAYQLRALGWRAHLNYDFQRAASLYEESLILYRTIRDQNGIDKVLYNLAYLAQNAGNYEQASELYEEYLLNQRKAGNKARTALALRQLAQLFYLSSAEPPLNDIHCMLDEGLLLAQQLGDPNIRAGLQGIMSMVAFHRGDLHNARTQIEETIQFCRDSGRQQNLGSSLVLLARIAVAQGEYSAARVHFSECLINARQQGDSETLSDCLLGLATLALAQKQYTWATRLCGSEEKIREEAHITIYPVERKNYEHMLVTLRVFLGEKAFLLLWAEGYKMSPEEACAPRAALPLIHDVPPILTNGPKGTTYPAGLSTRQVEILRLVAHGLSDAEVAERLIISPRTVNTHLTSIYHKLEVNSRAAATRFAFEHHLA